jgi:1-acyl-sn-glycerol-3-phosphate acyltransferase
MQRFRSGVARIAARSGAPVMPIGIRGSFTSLPRSRRIPRPVRVRIHVGAPIMFPQAPWDGSPTPVAVQAFLGILVSEVGALSGEMSAQRAR